LLYLEEEITIKMDFKQNFDGPYLTVSQRYHYVSIEPIIVVKSDVAEDVPGMIARG